MARGRTWKEIGGVTLEIIEGAHDDDISYIQQACAARVKFKYRKGAQFKLVGTKSVELEGKTARVIRPNSKTISIEVVGLGEYNVSPHLLQPLS